MCAFYEVFCTKCFVRSILYIPYEYSYHDRTIQPFFVIFVILFFSFSSTGEVLPPARAPKVKPPASSTSAPQQHQQHQQQMPAGGLPNGTPAMSEANGRSNGAGGRKPGAGGRGAGAGGGGVGDWGAGEVRAARTHARACCLSDQNALLRVCCCMHKHFVFSSPSLSRQNVCPVVCLSPQTEHILSTVALCLSAGVLIHSYVH